MTPRAKSSFRSSFSVMYLVPEMIWNKLQGVLSQIQIDDISRINQEADDGSLQSFSASEGVPDLPPKATFAPEEPLTYKTIGDPRDEETIAPPESRLAVTKTGGVDIPPQAKKQLSIAKNEAVVNIRPRPLITLNKGTNTDVTHHSIDTQTAPMPRVDQSTQNVVSTQNMETQTTPEVVPPMDEDVTMTEPISLTTLRKNQCPVCKGKIDKCDENAV